MEFFRDFGCVWSYRRALSFSALVLACLLAITLDSVQAADNVNVSGSPKPGYDWDPNRQENEVSCGIDPDNELVKLCAANWYGYADLPNKQGDAWIGALTTNNGHDWTHQPITGYKGDPNGSLNAGFAADPTVVTFPRGAIITNIAGDRDGNTKMYVQRLVRMPRETGIPYALEFRQQVATDFNGINFIDKPHTEIIIPPGGEFREVTITTNEEEDDPDNPGSTRLRQETRLWPEFKICISYAVFGGSNQNVRTFATCSDDFGADGSWSNPRQITQNNIGGVDQGMSSAAIGDDMLYITRRFGQGEDAIIGALAKGGERPGKTIEITGICPFDQDTAPNAGNTKRSAPRSFGFPWLSATDEYYVLTYADRPRDLQGNCLTVDEQIAAGVGGTRTMIRTSKDGRSWSDAVPVLPFAGEVVHFDFQPNVACARGTCNVVYYSTLTEALAFRAAIGAVAKAKNLDAEQFIEDFDVIDDSGLGLGLLTFRRSVDVYSTNITIQSDGQKGMPLVSDPSRISQYQLDYTEAGEPFEIEWNSLGNLIYGGMTLPFHGDYLANAVSDWRKNPVTGLYESNAAPIGDVNDAINKVRYFAAWTDHRRIRGVQYDDAGYEPDSGQTPGPLPFETIEPITESSTVQRDDGDAATADDSVRVASLGEPGATPAGAMDRLPGGPMARARAAVTNERPDRFLSAYGKRAEGLKDREAGQPAPPQCMPGNPEQNFNHPFFNTNAKNAEIYGAVVDPSVRLVSPVISKGFISTANIPIPLQRGFVVGIDNISAEEPADPTQPARRVLLVIANQPGETPASPDTYVPTVPVAPVLPKARASWRQLPFGPTFVAGTDLPPVIDELVEIDPLETEYVTLFVVASVNDAPVTVYAYDADNDYDFLGQLTVNGNAELGDLIDAPGVATSINLEEIHDPALIEPVWGELDIIPLASSYDNPNVRSPNARSTNYQSPNVRSPNARSVTYESTNQESTSLQSPNVRSPNVRSTALTADSFVDVTYTLESENNTITAVNADFAYGGDEIDDENVQVIAWREDLLTTAQNCENGLISESKVISSNTSPNVRSLAPADILDPFQGEVTFTLAPAGPDARAFVTMRVFCNDTEIDPESGRTQCQDLVTQDQEGGTSKLQNNIGYNFWAQKANTGKTAINTENEQIFKDVIPPNFLKDNGYEFRAVATSPSGADVDITTGIGTVPAADLIGALDNGVETDVTCMLDLDGDPTMPGIVTVPVGVTGVTCTAQDEATDPDGNPAPNIGMWNGTIVVEDNSLPILSIPGPTLEVGPDSVDSSGNLQATVDYLADGAFAPLYPGIISVTDEIDPDFDAAWAASQLLDGCVPANGGLFTDGTVVTCTVSDHGPNSQGGVNTSTGMFTINVEDNTPPTITAPADITIQADGNPPGTTLTCDDLGMPTGDDATGTPTFDCNVGTLALTLGANTVTWTATDLSGNEATDTQTVTIEDNDNPVVSVTITDGPEQIAFSLAGLEIDFEVIATDDFLDAGTVACTANNAPVTSGDIFPLGETTITCTAEDTSGNQGSDSATVNIVFNYMPSGLNTTKKNPRSGTSIPVVWSWDVDGVPQNVGDGNQTVTVAEGSCDTANPPFAEDPGISGIQLKADNTYQYNWQAVDSNGNNLPAPAAYCLAISLIPATQDPQTLTINLKP